MSNLLLFRNLIVMSKRVFITIPDQVHQQLQKLAKIQGRPTANLAAYLVEKGVESAINQGQMTFTNS